MTITLTAAEDFIFNRLDPDEVLDGLIDGRFYSDVAPEGTPSPWVVYQCQTPESRSVRGLGGVIIMLDEIYTIRAICEGSDYAPIKPIAERIVDLLHNYHGPVTDGYVLACQFLGPVKYFTVENGIQYRHLGGTFRINSQ